MKKVGALITIAILIAGFAWLAYYDTFGFEAAPPVYLQSGSFDKWRPVAIIGDTQRTTWVENKILRRENNLKEQEILFEALKREGPSLLVFLGDLVARGNSSWEWAHFDKLVTHFFSLKTPILATLGSHEYDGPDRWALAKAKARFPRIANKSWFVLLYQNLAFIFVDSNRSEISADLWNEQREWFRSTLETLDANSAIDGVIVFSHHPPFTNSIVTENEKHMHETFLPAFFSSVKSLVMVSGHAHSYERFHEQGKYFLVSGGGGGPRVRLLEGESQRQPDLFRGPSPRPFHYLLLLSVQGGITLEAKGFERGDTHLNQIDKFFVPFRVSAKTTL
jgi:hypothetical protein